MITDLSIVLLHLPQPTHKVYCVGRHEEGQLRIQPSELHAGAIKGVQHHGDWDPALVLAHLVWGGTREGGPQDVVPFLDDRGNGQLDPDKPEGQYGEGFALNWFKLS